MGNTCYYGLTRQDCEREDFANISCCSLSVRSLPQQWTCGEREQSVKEPCGGKCPRSTEKGYYIGSRLLEDYVLCQGNTKYSSPYFRLETVGLCYLREDLWDCDGQCLPKTSACNGECPDNRHFVGDGCITWGNGISQYLS